MDVRISMSSFLTELLIDLFNRNGRAHASQSGQTLILVMAKCLVTALLIMRSDSGVSTYLGSMAYGNRVLLLD